MLPNADTVQCGPVDARRGTWQLPQRWQAPSCHVYSALWIAFEYLWSHTEFLFSADRMKSIELFWYLSLVVKAQGARIHWKRSPGLGKKAEYMSGLWNLSTSNTIWSQQSRRSRIFNEGVCRDFKILSLREKNLNTRYAAG